MITSTRGGIEIINETPPADDSVHEVSMSRANILHNQVKGHKKDSDAALITFPLHKLYTRELLKCAVTPGGNYLFSLTCRNAGGRLDILSE